MRPRRADCGDDDDDGPASGCAPRSERESCPPSGGDGKAELSLEQIVERYLAGPARRAREEQRSFRREPSLKAAVSRAAHARTPDGKRHSHQRRIPAGVLAECRQRLLRALAQLRRAQTFDELHALVEHAIRDIPGVGELLVYDTAARIGAKLRLRPQRVYLHAGTRDGARALGAPRSARVLEKRDLPRPLRRLAPDDLENFLCIYKRRLERLRDGSLAR